MQNRRIKMDIFGYTLGLGDYIALVSIIINIFLSWSWVTRRILLDQFLSGQWVGQLRSKNDTSFAIDCEMAISGAEAQCNGYLYYKSSDGNGTFAQGIDKLSDYGASRWLRPNINLVFSRECHFDLRDNKTQRDEKWFEYKLDVVNRALADRVYCTLTNVKNDTISGHLYRKDR